MAIRCGNGAATSGYIRRTAGYPSVNGPYTYAFWVYFVTVGDWQTLVDYSATTTAGNGGAADNTTFILQPSAFIELFTVSHDQVGTTPISPATWYHIALIHDGTNLYAYVNGALEVGPVGENTGPGADTAIFMGRDNGDSTSANARFAAVKVWDAALTQAEIQQEMLTIRPSRLANLNGWYPMFADATDAVRDYSGNGGDWTRMDTTSDEAGPPISWGASRRRIKFKPSSGTLYFQSCSGGITPSGTLSKQTNRPLTGGITPAGALVKQTIRATTGAITPVGVLLKQLTRALAGGITPTGALVSQKQRQKALSGSISPTGVISKSTQRPLSGSMTPSGTVARSTQKSLSGGVTPSGTLSRLTSRLLSGGITPSGVLTAAKVTVVALVGAILPTGVLSSVYQAGGGVVAFVQQFWPRRRRRRR